MPVAVKQLNAELFFNLVDQSRLSDMQTLGCLRNMQALYHLNEIP